METNKTTFDFHEIKTFEDACKKLGMKEHLLTGSMGGDREAQGQAQALYKLLIIQKAMNNGKCCNKNGYSYYPHWNFYTETLIKYETEKSKKEKGIKKIFPYDYMLDKEYSYVRCSPISHRTPFAETSNGFPLCFNSKEAAIYAAKQFEDLFFQYYGIKVKE